MSEPAISKRQPRKMPTGRPFQKGVSGNPSGRPAGLAEFQERCRGYTPEALQALVDGLIDQNSRVRIEAAKELLDRGWGKAAQVIEAQGSLTIVVATGLNREPGA